MIAINGEKNETKKQRIQSHCHCIVQSRLDVGVVGVVWCDAAGLSLDAGGLVLRVLAGVYS